MHHGIVTTPPLVQNDSQQERKRVFQQKRKAEKI